MSWQGSQTAADRFFGSIAYLLPIIEVFGFGIFIFEQVPLVQQLYLPLMPLILLYVSINSISAGGIGIGGFIFFLVLYVGVVKNPQIARFIRFNTLQAILIGILISLCSITLDVVLPLFGRGEIGLALKQVIYNVVFLGTIVACIYSIVMSVLGKYTDIPKLSEAAQLHIDSY